MRKLIILAGLAAFALLVGFAGVRVDKADATPREVLAIAPSICVAFTIDADWPADNAYPGGTDPDGDTVVNIAGDLDGDGDADDTDNAIWACVPDAGAGGLLNPANLAVVAEALDGDVDADTFAAMAEASGSQLIEDQNGPWGGLYIVAFVSNDDNVTLLADEGVFATADANSNVDCATEIGDEDCDEDGTEGDGVIVALLLGNGVADRGEQELVVSQSGVDLILDYTVVGEPDDLELALVGGDTIQGGMSAADCEELDVGDFTDEIGAPEVTGLLGTVSDDDGTAIAGIFVDFTSDDEDVANVNLASSISVDAGDDIIAAPNLICGDEPGEAEIEGEVAGGPDDTVDVTVIGGPDAMTLTASPATIQCDGVTSSTVAAAVVDSDGNPVVAGNTVRFDVVALGTSDPIVTATDEEGTASSTITPLSGVSAGVVVLVTVPDFDLEGSIRVDCAPPAPTVAPPPPATPVPPVTPPRTGDAGLLP